MMSEPDHLVGDNLKSGSFTEKTTNAKSTLAIGGRTNSFFRGPISIT